MTLIDDLKSLLPNAGGRLEADVPMAGRSTFRIGGPADILFEPQSSEEAAVVIQYCRRQDVSLTILGSGSNVLISDLGIRGVVMIIGDSLSAIERRGNVLVAQAGCRLSTLAARAAKSGLAGLEFASGIPGSLGGAILMNAGAYGNCMAEVVVLTEYLDPDGEFRTAVGPDHQFGYRRSIFSNRDTVILRACIELAEEDPARINSRISELNRRRRDSQPLDMPSAGSAFKRPTGHYAGKLISDCGLKGCRVGNAQVSEKHAGFIVNTGNACAADTRQLFSHVQSVVAERTGVHLVPEVRFVGDWQDWEIPGCHDRE